jgi:Ubiquitin-protein ligase
MKESPRIRRLRSDHQALAQLAAESTIFDFQAYGTPPDFYVLRFRGHGVCKRERQGEILVREEHEVHVRLGASYPRTMPELAWKSPVFHPNISASGVVCLGGYGTHWVPSLALDELCGMLWDMIRFENYDESSPYNREAAAWAKNQTTFRFPVDDRPLRNKLMAGGYGSSPAMRESSSQPQPDVLFVGDVQIVEAELVTQQGAARQDAEILFIN